MKLSDIEFRAMDSWWRRWGQEYFEMPVLGWLGLNLKDKDVLEIGSGNGYGAHLIHQRSPRSYVGLDVMEEQIEKARQRYPQYQFLVQDATDLSQFGNASKDVIIIFGVLHHIPEWRKVIDEITRVLKPNGGTFFLEEPRGTDLKLFDFFFRWGHPDSDFRLKVMEGYLKSRGFHFKKQWTPLMTIYRAQL